ncbi:MAG: hypothetical protein ACREPN_10460 [Rudaea sp.]
MIRYLLALVLSVPALAAFAAADSCSVSGTAFDFGGRPQRAAVVRLLDMQTRQAAFAAANAHAGYVFADLTPGVQYRLDLLGAPIAVTGTHLPTRSIIGMSPAFACSDGQRARADVRAAVD